MLHLFTTIAGIRCYLETHRLGKTVGFVPTMGALHVGHLSLIERAKRENDLVVVSIFVNPLQFGPQEDLGKYPRQLKIDRDLCAQSGVDAIFAPSVAEMGIGEDKQGEGEMGRWGDGESRREGAGEQGSRGAFFTQHSTLNTPHFLQHSTLNTQHSTLTQVMPPEGMTSVLCGQSRPGHFQGVATIVTKLLNIVQPERAYFGQKDAQQLAIIRQLAADLNCPTQIVGCPIVREASGLACSSRNQYLTDEQKQQAASLYRSLQRAEKLFQTGIRDRLQLLNAVKAELSLAPDIRVEYVELVHPQTLASLEAVDESALLASAAKIGTTRLIDNVLLLNRLPIVAIDGPAGAGKSTVARQVAKVLGLNYLDTGAMYRAVTWLVLQSGIALDDEPAIAELVSRSQIEFDLGVQSPAPVPVWINGREVTQEIRTLEVTSKVSAIAALPFVRQALVKIQHRLGQRGGVVAEGRDIGTHVFPDAEVKIFLTASIAERARRRQQDLKQQQTDISLEQLEADIEARDLRDSTRAVAPLRKAADAIEIITDNLTIPEVIERIVSLYHQKLQKN
ncbi:MAG: bifunctional pantoate--beta-alanine ligase/(d)CMP kinase [Cyanosarcina radialis HA8281-LM2]|jgi:pantoate ligase/cytidylate kinase|nr:bifunctional pantoate--beta-alanine ligase/(d)CMP kinase [Cyanosarcina radialis HA8281-LM2]